MPRWWPAPPLCAGVLAALLTPAWHGLWPIVVLAALLPPYLLLLGNGAAGALHDAFWKRHRVVPLVPTALERAAGADTLVLPSGAVWEDGTLAAVEFRPLRGVTVREVAAAARQASLREEDGPGRSVVILAKRAGLRTDLPVREPRCGVVEDVARQVAESGGAWPEEARELERALLARGGRCLAVADGGRPLGLVELRASESAVTLDDVVLAGVALVDIRDPAQIPEAVALLAGRGRHVTMALESGMPGPVPEGAAFVLAGPAWLSSRPTALDLDAHPAKLLAVLVAARRARRRCAALVAAGGIADAARVLIVAPVAAAAWRGFGSTLGLDRPLLVWLGVVGCAAVLAWGFGRLPAALRPRWPG